MKTYILYWLFSFWLVGLVIFILLFDYSPIDAHNKACFVLACVCERFQHSTSVGAHHPLWVFTQLFTLLLGKVTLLLELAGVSSPAFVTLTHPTVAVAAVWRETQDTTCCLSGLQAEDLSKCYLKWVRWHCICPKIIITISALVLRNY